MTYACMHACQRSGVALAFLQADRGAVTPTCVFLWTPKLCTLLFLHSDYMTCSGWMLKYSPLKPSIRQSIFRSSQSHLGHVTTSVPRGSCRTRPPTRRGWASSWVIQIRPQPDDVSTRSAASAESWSSADVGSSSSRKVGFSAMQIANVTRCACPPCAI